MSIVHAIYSFGRRLGITLGAAYLISQGIDVVAGLFSLWMSIPFVLVWSATVGFAWYHLIKLP